MRTGQDLAYGSFSTPQNQSSASGSQTAATSNFVPQTQTQDEYIQNSEFLSGIVNQTQSLVDSIGTTITDLRQQSADAMVDTEGLVGQLTDAFDATKNNILNAASVSSQRISMEMDAYMGSSGSDARSAVRRNMASSVTSGLLAQSSQAVAGLYKDYVSTVIDTTLKGQSLNAGIIAQTAQTIGDLTGQAGSLLLGTSGAVINSYTQAMQTSIAAMQLQSDNYFRQQQLQLGQSQLLASQGELINVEQIVDPATGQYIDNPNYHSRSFGRTGGYLNSL